LATPIGEDLVLAEDAEPWSLTRLSILVPWVAPMKQRAQPESRHEPGQKVFHELGGGPNLDYPDSRPAPLGIRRMNVSRSFSVVVMRRLSNWPVTAAVMRALDGVLGEADLR